MPLFDLRKNLQDIKENIGKPFKKVMGSKENEKDKV